TAISNNSNGGRLFVSGGELYFYNDYFQDLNTSTFINQSLNWLLENSSRSDQNNISCQIVINQSITDLQENNKNEIAIFITNKTTLEGVTGLDLDTELNVTVFNNDTSKKVFESNSSNLNQIENGVYNMILNLTDNGTYIVNATIYDGVNVVGIGSSAFQVVNTTTEIVKVLINNSTILDEDSAIVRGSGSVEINVTLRDVNNLDVDGVNISCYITSVAPFDKNISINRFYLANITTLNATEANFTRIFVPQNALPAGKYNIFILVNDSHGFVNYKSYSTYFFLSNEYPTITLAKMNGINVGPTSFGTATLGDTLSIQISGTDTEDSLANMSAFALVASLFLIPGHGYAIYKIVKAEEIYYQPLINQFSGTLYIPWNGITTMLGTSYNLGSGLYVLMLFIRDSDGGWDTDSYTYMQLLFMPEIDITAIIILVIITLGLIGAAAGLIIWKRKRYKKQYVEEFNKICTFCGQQIPSEAQFCIHCGKTVEKTSKMDDIISDLKKNKELSE
ncbi:MAG: zinc ribbon domain-containing protein, partial [Candidatus Helarchaeota archaeon]